MTTPVEDEVQQQGDLQLTSSAFAAGEQLPDYTGYANENANPPLSIDGVPGDAESLVLIVDDPDAKPAVGHVWDHWLVWDIDPARTELPRDWEVSDDGGTVGYNDYVERDWGGPAPPEGSHTYSFKLLALDTWLEMPPPTRKARLGSEMTMAGNVLASTQITGTYDASQGTIF